MRTATNNFLSILLLSGLLCPLSLFGQDSLNVSSLSRTWEAWAIAYDIVAQGDYIYVASGPTGLRILDATNRAAPVEVGRLFMDMNAECVDVQDGFAYVGSNSRFCVIDVSIPDAPYLLGYVEAGAQSVAANGNYVYARTGTSSGTVFEVTDPQTPGIAGSWNCSANIQSIDISQNVLFAATNNRIETFDLVDPSAPAALGFSDEGGGVGIDVEGDFAYLIYYQVLRIYDVSVPASPQLLRAESGYDGEHILVIGDVAFVGGNFYSSFKSVDVSDRTNPFVIDWVGSVDGCLDFVTIGDMLYVATWFEGIAAFDFTNPSDVEEVGGYDPPSAINSIAIIGDELWAGSRSLLHVNIVAPTNPVVLEGSINGRIWYENSVAADGERLMVADTTSFTIWNLADPNNAELIAESTHSASKFRCGLKGDLCYYDWGGDIGNSVTVLNWLNGNGLDISAPSRTAFDSSNPILWCGTNNGQPVGRLRAYDVTNSETPIQLCDVLLSNRPIRIFEQSDLLAVAFADSGVSIYDVSDATSPTLLSNIPATDATDVAISGGFLTIAQGYGGVSLWDIFNPVAPEIAGYYNTFCSAQNVLMRDTLLIVNDLGGVEILNISDALSLRRQPAAPQHLTARVVGSSLHLFWDEVTTSIYGRPLENVIYKVWATTDPTLPHELYSLVRTTRSPVVQLDIANLGSRGQFFVTAE